MHTWPCRTCIPAISRAHNDATTLPGDEPVSGQRGETARHCFAADTEPSRESDVRPGGWDNWRPVDTVRSFSGRHLLEHVHQALAGRGQRCASDLLFQLLEATN